MRTLLALTLLFCNAPVLAATQPDRWEPDIRRFEEVDQANSPQPSGIVFIGSSTIRMWDTELFFPAMGVVNRGFGGSELADAVRYFDRIVLPHRPRAIVLYSGGNDIARGKRAEVVDEDFGLFLKLVREKLPASRLIFIAIAPSVARWSQRTEQLRANELIRARAESDPLVTFIDPGPAMLGADGTPRPELYVQDMLHLNHAGYSLLTSLVRPLLAGSRQQLWITNSFGDDVHVYEVGTWELLRRFSVGPEPHGIAATADGRTVVIAVENFKGKHGELVWVDTATFNITHRLPVGPLPNEIECTPDGKWVYVPCADETWWVVDGASKQVVKQIKTGGRPHNTVVSPDGRRMYLSAMGIPSLTITDTTSEHEVIGRIAFDYPLRPPAMTADEMLFLQNVDSLLGFQVADIAGRRVTGTIRHEYAPDRTEPSRCHGLAIRPDQQEVWCCDVERNILHIHEAISGQYKQTQAIEMPGRVYWVSFSPDGRYGFLSVRSIGKVAVVDSQSKQLLTMLDAGNTPKRTQVITVAP